MRRIAAPLAAAALLAGLAASAAATIVLRVTPRELADTAHLVVEGRVAAVDVRWDDGRTCINHYVTFTVDRTHKGPAAASVVIKVPGGRVGEEEVRVEGTATFAVGEEAVVFLWKDARGEWIVLGEAQGKFLLTRDEKTALRRAENSLRGLCLVVRGDPKSAEAARAKRPDSLPLDDLVAVVKASVEAAKRAAAGGPATATGGGAGPVATEPGGDGAGEGRDPAPPEATPDPPSGTTTDGGAPPPTKDVPAPPAGKPVTPAGDEPKPEPATKR
jgi:hypothetical protein